MFVMTHNKIYKVLVQWKKFTYSNQLVDYCPQKEDPYMNHITARGNLVTYNLSPSVCMADLDKAK